MFNSNVFARLSLVLFAILSAANAALAHHHHHHTHSLAKRDGAGSVVTAPNGLKWYKASHTTGTTGRQPVNSYVCYSGPSSNFPPISTWINYNDMWSNAVQYALTPIGDTSAQIADIQAGILAVSKQAMVDARVILAVILLESTGNVKVKCTTSFGGVPNCGLMQSYNGTSFMGTTAKASIQQMIVDGTQGTQYGPGLVQLFNDASDTPRMSNGNVYKVLREYNSGTVDPTNLSSGNGATNSYVSNIANYLQGWNGYGDGPASCTFVTSTTAAATSTTTVTTTQTVTATRTASPAALITSASSPSRR